MKTKKEEVIGKYIGNTKHIIGKIMKSENSIEKLKEYYSELENININSVVKKALEERAEKSEYDKIKTALVVIDNQNSFLPDGELGVEGANEDLSRLMEFMWENMEKITKIYPTIDTHNLFHIFMGVWWRDKSGNNPAPFTVITAEDVENGLWIPNYYEKESIECVKALSRPLVIWSYHTEEGTEGEALERNFGNFVYFHSALRKSEIGFIRKGLSKTTERYGAFKPEYNPNNEKEIEKVDEIWSYDRIVFAGQAKSHCVLETIRQFIEEYKDNQDMMKKIYILDDCMSAIAGFEKITEDGFREFRELGINIVKSRELKL